MGVVGGETVGAGVSVAIWSEAIAADRVAVASAMPSWEGPQPVANKAITKVMQKRFMVTPNNVDIRFVGYPVAPRVVHRPGRLAGLQHFKIKTLRSGLSIFAPNKPTTVQFGAGYLEIICGKVE